MAAESPWRFEPWPWLLAALRLAMMGSSLLLWSIAAAHPDGLVTDDAWRDGLSYNEQVAAIASARAQGVGLGIETRPRPDGIEITASPSTPGPVDTIRRVSVQRVRPAESGFDEVFELAANGDGWSGVVPLPLVGRWRFVVTAELEAGRQRYELERWHAGEAP